MSRSTNRFTTWTNPANTDGDRVKEPEEHLFIAVLWQATHDAFSKHVSRLERDSARNFFLSRSERFRKICEGAGRDPQYVHEKVKKQILKENGWNVAVSCSVDGHTRSYRQAASGKKRGPKHSLNGAKYGRPKKKKLTENSYYAAMNKKVGRPRLYG